MYAFLRSFYEMRKSSPVGARSGSTSQQKGFWENALVRFKKTRQRGQVQNLSYIRCKLKKSSSSYKQTIRTNKIKSHANSYSFCMRPKFCFGPQNSSWGISWLCGAFRHLNVSNECTMCKFVIVTNTYCLTYIRFLKIVCKYTYFFTSKWQIYEFFQSYKGSSLTDI